MAFRRPCAVCAVNIQWPKSGYPLTLGFSYVGFWTSLRYTLLDFNIPLLRLKTSLSRLSIFLSHRDSGVLRGDSPPITERIASVVSNHNLRCLHMARPTLTLANDVSSPLLQAKFLQRLWCISMFFGAESQADRQAISCVNGGMHLKKLHIGAASSQDWIDLTFPGLQMLEFFFCYARMPIYTFVSRHPLLSRVRIRTVRLDYSTQGGTWRSVDQMVPWFKTLRDKLNFLSYFPGDISEPIFEKDADSNEWNCTEIAVHLMSAEDTRVEGDHVPMLQATRVVCESFPKLRKLSIFASCTVQLTVKFL